MGAMNALSDALTTRPVLLAMTFFLGIAIQCIGMLRRRPPRWAVFTFLGLLGYMLFMMVYSALSHSAEYPQKQLSRALLPMLFSFSFVFSFIFIAVFLKELVKTIDESVIFSMTISFWFLLLYRAGDFGTHALAVLAVLGAVPTVGSSIALLYRRGGIRNTYKLLFYGWYLLVNAVFAFAVFKALPTQFFLTASPRMVGEATFLDMLMLGMVCAYLMFNAGLLYYAGIYSLLSSEARRQLVSLSDNLFSDRRIEKREIYRIVAVQTAYFAALALLDPAARLYLLSFWILLTPIIVMSLLAVTGMHKRASTAGPSEDRKV